MIREAAFQNRSVVQFKAMPTDMSKYLVKAGLLARLFTLVGLAFVSGRTDRAALAGYSVRRWLNGPSKPSAGGNLLVAAPVRCVLPGPLDPNLILGVF